jgi:hypothetical protein
VVKINGLVTDRADCAAYMQARDAFMASTAAEVSALCPSYMEDDDEDAPASDDEDDKEEGEPAVPAMLPASTLLVVSGFSRPGVRLIWL